jgi:hypothetical protein
VGGVPLRARDCATFVEDEVEVEVDVEAEVELEVDPGSPVGKDDSSLQPTIATNRQLATNTPHTRARFAAEPMHSLQQMFSRRAKC